MAAPKRASTRSRLLKRAVKAGRSALREAEKRVPGDLRQQLERTIKDGQKTLQSALQQVQAQVDRTARQADLDKALKRLDGLSRQVQQLARAAASRGAEVAPRKTERKPAGRHAAARQPAARRSAAPKAAPKTAARGIAAARRPSSRRTAAAAGPHVEPAPPGSMPGPPPKGVDADGNAS
ncbi:hypothetical protein EPN29_05500 [bacterium]|nr:MAG: hypothetical protein EPN29_05500 [bacterium]